MSALDRSESFGGLLREARLTNTVLYRLHQLKVSNPMKKFVLSLYVLGTVIIIKGLFRGGIVDGAFVILIGCALIGAAYYIGKHTRRY